MIAIKPKKNAPKRKRKPYYTLKYKYMIGDANGNTERTLKLSVDNPHIERFCRLLNKLKPTKGTWGLCLDTRTLDSLHYEKQITFDEYIFLGQTLFDGWEPTEDEYVFPELTEKEQEHLGAFFEGVRSETEYSFLVFKGVELLYHDEDGVTHETTFKNTKKTKDGSKLRSSRKPRAGKA